jgi:hypothetical protein
MAPAFTATEWMAQAQRAGQSLEKYVGSIAVYEETLKAKHDSRAALPDAREKITTTAESMDGAILDATVEDLLSRSTVRRTQGTAAFARNVIKRLRLQYQPQTAVN